MNIPGTIIPSLGAVIGLILLLPSLAVAWRRLHDTGRSGWWIGGPWLGLLGTLMLLGIFAETSPHLLDLDADAMVPAMVGGLLVWFGLIIAVLIFLCLPGHKGPNRFG